MDDFWDMGSQESGPSLTDEAVQAAERELGCRLPASHVGLLRTQNGGYPRRSCFPLPVTLGRRPRFVRLSRFVSICDRGNPTYSQVMVPEWEYPDVGLVIADTSSGGHDAVLLDYSECGPQGEPQVVHVETECAEPEVTVLAPNFAAGLVDCPD